MGIDIFIGSEGNDIFFISFENGGLEIVEVDVIVDFDSNRDLISLGNSFSFNDLFIFLSLILESCDIII